MIRIALVFICCLVFFIVCDLNVANAKIVVFNTKTLKYHNVYCKWAQKCTVNCIKLEQERAIKRSGKACKVCGG